MVVKRGDDCFADLSRSLYSAQTATVAQVQASPHHYNHTYQRSKDQGNWVPTVLLESVYQFQLITKIRCELAKKRNQLYD